MNRTKVKKFLLELLLTLALSCLLSGIGYVLLNGWPLTQAPGPEDLVSVAYIDASLDSNGTLTAPDDLKLAGGMVGSTLAYVPLADPPEEDRPLQVTYTLRDGRQVSMEIGQQTVQMDGKVHMLKNPEMFLKLFRGCFYPQA